MTTTLNLTDSVGAWVTECPATSRVFEKHRIDYCCGGSRPLEEACRKRQIDAQAVYQELRQIISGGASNPPPDDDFASSSLAEMCESIEATHHEYLKRELPRLRQLVTRVAQVHGERHPWLLQLETAFQQLHDELVPHMLKEERVLFPAIRMIEQSPVLPAFPFGSVDNPIRMMEHEHDIAGQALQEIRRSSSDFTLPEGGCNTFRAMLDGLRELEADLHCHIHKENNILFPRASQLSARLSGPVQEGNAVR
ncbi:MAG: iron-sulfur cluster repair di-iron protein [Planctomycetaceae bacterium]|nr:iron-sulfur cluster repair di-iron protein [Planctomycetaceae bacterium]